MKNLLKYTLGIIILFSCCTEQINIERPYPKIETLEVTNITESGAVFNASITNEDHHEIIEYGFVVGGTVEPPLINSNETTTIYTPIVSGGFSKELQKGMNKGQKYGARSYLKTNDYLVYGNVIIFTSLGSLPTTIDQIVPDNGVSGDTIKIFGKNLSSIKKRIVVTFNGKGSEIIDSSDSMITCIVPYNILGPRSASLVIYVYGKTFQKKFTIN